MKRLLCVLIVYFPLVIYAQGIKWTEGLTWEQVKEKAEKEEKYIFLDCFATWCGPCKRMDREVYINKMVGNVFNEKFISIKVQMDQTKNDNNQIKSWYQDAKSLSSQYKITIFPTYIFLSSNGAIVHKETGFKEINEFVKIAETATNPGQVYNDPYAEYDRLIENYRQGDKEFKRMIYMIRTTHELSNWKLADSITSDYCNYLLGLKQDQLYTKENISFISSIDTKIIKDKFFVLFYPDGKNVDVVMNKKGYAQGIVDKIIQKEDVEPFINIRSTASGMQAAYVKTPKELPALDWKKLSEIIRKKYNADYARRNVLDAMISWYSRYAIYSKYIEYFIIRFKKYGVDRPDYDPDLRLNWVAWDVFEQITDMSQINFAIQWMEGVVKRSPDAPGYIDTYANLLYKAGRKQEALNWEEKALEMALKKQDINDINEFRKNIEKMKCGKPTWPEK